METEAAKYSQGPALVAVVKDLKPGTAADGVEEGHAGS